MIDLVNSEAQNTGQDALVVTVPDTRTGADLIAALQASPCREISLEPSRAAMPALPVHISRMGPCNNRRKARKPRADEPAETMR